MQNICQAAKYTLYELGLKILGLGISFLALDLFSIALSRRDTLGISSEITIIPFLLGAIIGIGLFKIALNFNLANGVARYEYLAGYLVAIFFISLPLSILDWLSHKFWGEFIEYNIFRMIYQTDRLLPWGFFNFSLAVFILIGGLFLSLIIYRGKIMELLGLGALLSLITVILHKISAGIAGKKLLLWIFKAMGLQPDSPKPLAAAVTFLILSGGLIALNYLLIRKAEIKN